MISWKDMGYFKLIEIQGAFSVEDIYRLRKVIFRSAEDGGKLIFSLAQATLEGSSGLIGLLQDLNELGQKPNVKVNLVGSRPELKRLVKGLSLEGLHLYEDVHCAIRDFLPQNLGNSSSKPL